MTHPASPQSSARPIIVVGPGATGLVLASFLASTHEVFLLGRHAPHHKDPEPPSISALDPRGLPYSISDERGVLISNHQIRSIEAIDIPHLDPVMVAFCVKTYDLADALRNVLPHARKDTPWLLLQNGLNVFLDAWTLVRGAAPLLRGLLSFGALRSSAQQVTMFGRPALELASRPEEESLRNSACTLLEAAGISVRIASSIALAEWNKALVNLCVNTICSAFRTHNGALIEDPMLRALATRTLDEVRSIAARDGFPNLSLSNDAVLAAVAEYRSNRNSTLVDIERGASTELPFILGRALHLARHYDIETPTLSSLAAQLSEPVVRTT